jgi:class 3 adenylate cyclase/tetratricopeptide (TPR) repeat protein
MEEEPNATSRSCASCQATSPQGARFCLACGTELGATAEAERRVITVLFADLSGFTAVTERLDPEQVRQLIDELLQPMCDAVIRWGGFVDKFIGDCVMALFGAPVAYENEAERAVRAALDMEAALARWSADESARGGRPPLRLKIGVNTGPVVTGTFTGGGARNYTAVGDAVNVAARLQGACTPGEILVGATTFEQTRHIVEYGEERELRVRGKKEPVRARVVVGLREERGQIRGFEGRRVQLIGRTAEMERLLRTWSEVREGVCRQALVVGAPGIGKTRLVEEFAAEALDGTGRCAHGRSYPYARVTPWEPIAELLRDLHHVGPDLAPVDAAAMILDNGSYRSAVDEPALGVALGAPVSSELAGYGDAELQAVVADAVLSGFEAVDGDPAVLILEDLQWADRATLRFLASLPERDVDMAGLFLLVTRPPLPGEEHLTRLLRAYGESLELRSLSADETRLLIDGILGDHRLPDSLVRKIISRTDGNPLFVEEMLRSLMERQVIRQEDGCWQSGAASAEVDVPESIESILSTRIDGLGVSTKRVLQYAAIVGRRFWRGVLSEALVRRPVDVEMAELLGSEMVRAQDESAVAGDREYMFEHLLLQEVAYEGLLRGRRAQLHGDVARWLEQQLLARNEEADDLIAYHWERSSTPEQAIPFLQRRAQRARERGALADAAEIIDRALEVCVHDGERAVLLALGEEIAAAMGDAPKRLKLIEELEGVGRELEDGELAAESLYRRGRYLLATGEIGHAQEAGAAALEAFQALGRPSRQGDLHSLLGRIAQTRGDYPKAREHYEEALPLLRRSGDRPGEAEVLDRLGLVQVDLDDFCRALLYLDDVLDLCKERGLQMLEVRVRAHRATALRWIGCYREAEEAARSAVALAERTGSRRALSTSRMTLGFVLAAAGRKEEAREVLRDAIERASEIDRPALAARSWLSLAEIEESDEADRCARQASRLAVQTGLVHVDILARARLAELAMDAGDLSAALAASGESLDKLREHGSIQGPEEVVVYTRAKVLAAAGRHKEAGTLMEEARALLRTKAERIDGAEYRRAFLEEVHPNPEILRTEQPV